MWRFFVLFRFRPAATLLASANQLAKSPSAGPRRKRKACHGPTSKPNCRNAFIEPLSFPRFTLVETRRMPPKQVLASHDKPLFARLERRETAACELSNGFRAWLTDLPCSAKINMDIPR
jgi:hypothetical protein